MTTPLEDLVNAHVALAATADEIVALFAAKMDEIAASEQALRSAYVGSYPNQATFPKAGQSGLANYMLTLVTRLHAGDTRPDFILPVGDLAAQAWGGVA